MAFLKPLVAALLLASSAAQGTTIELPDYHNRLFDRTCCLVISHAGGSIDGVPYTNSRETLDANATIGRRTFEIDFSLTRDGQLALTHDWNLWRKQAGSAKDIEWPNSDQFLKSKLLGRLTPMTAAELASWLHAYPNTTIVTDTKDDFAAFTDALFSAPIDPDRLVVQVYGFDDLETLRSHTENARTILTIYKMKIAPDALIAKLRSSDVDALTIPLPRALAELARLREALPELPIYVHGKPGKINAVQLHVRLRELGASGFYLD